RVEACFEEFFRRGRGCFELQHPQGTDLWENTNEKGKKFFAKGGRVILGSPVLLITCAREIVQKLLFRDARLILHDLVLLKAPSNTRCFGQKLAHIVTI